MSLSQTISALGFPAERRIRVRITVDLGQYGAGDLAGNVVITQSRGILVIWKSSALKWYIYSPCMLILVAAGTQVAIYMRPLLTLLSNSYCHHSSYRLPGII